MNRLVLFLYVCVCAVGIATAQLRPTNEELGSIYFAYPSRIMGVMAPVGVLMICTTKRWLMYSTH